MASNSLPAPLRPANHEERDPATTTRRAILGATILAPAIIACATSAAATLPVTSRAKWDRLVAAFRGAEEKMNAISAEHTAAYERYQVEREMIGARPVAPERPALKYPKPIEQMTIAEIKAMPSTVSTEYRAYETDLAAWKAKNEELEAAITGGVDARWEAAVDEQDKAAHAVFAEPAPDRHALSFKMALAEKAYRGFDFNGDVTRQILADVRRVVAREA